MQRIIDSLRALLKGSWFKTAESYAKSVNSVSTVQSKAPTAASSSFDGINSKMQLSTTVMRLLSSQPRQPMIKFIGPRNPRPHYDPNSQAATSSYTASSSQSTKAKSGSLKQIFVDDPLQLPARFRRKDIADDEMEAINSGVFIARR
ncbi:ribosomal protein s36, mitochondrial domain-containing protein [Ditylenchus destructor]|nr:ribosomal protein s36, mitochondrial domain-containing protein [Ditylenchus destructor]